MTLGGLVDLFSSVIPYKIKPWAWQNEQWTSKSIPDLTGKVALVTGANGGVGRQTVLELYRNGAHVLMGCRSEANYETAREIILSRLEPKERRGKLSYLHADTSTIRLSQMAANNVLARHDITRLDIFIACAGKGSTVGPLNEDGVEPFMATNCLGHFALLLPLLPLIIQTSRESIQSSCRIVWVSSVTHRWSEMTWPFNTSPTFDTWENVNDARFGERLLYSRSKLGQILTMKHLNEDLAKENISCIAVHPGELDNRFVEKMMPPTYYPYMRSLLRWVLLNEDEGARTCLFAATSKEVDDRYLRGAYIAYPAHVEEPGQLARNKELSDTFWSLQVNLIQKQTRKNI